MRLIVAVPRGTSSATGLPGFTAGTIPVTFVAKASDGTTVLGTNVVEVTTANSGQSFTFTVGVPSGTATISLKPRFYLRKRFTAPANIGTDNTATLDISGAVFVGGDANGDNQVDGTDYAWIRYWWGTSLSLWTSTVGDNLTYDINGDGIIDGNDYPDLNGDGTIDALDYDILKNGWYQTGDPE